jgi:hypothetical protein
VIHLGSQPVGYSSHSLPSRPAFGLAMVDIFFDVSKLGGKIKYLVLR